MRRLALSIALAGAIALPQAASVVLSTGWTLRPAGTQVALDTFPMSSVVTPDGKFVAVLHAGKNKPSVWLLDVKTLKRVGQLELPDAWLGMALTPNGRLLYVSGASRAEVYEIAIEPEGKLNLLRTFPAVPEAERTRQDFLGDIQVTPDGRLLYIADLFRNRVIVINPSSGRVIEQFPTGRRPYRILFHPDGKSYFVTSWADASVHQHETDSGRQLNFIRIGQHPTDMLWREKKTGEDQEAEEGQGTEAFPYKARLFVTTANTNSVQVVGVSESKDLRRLETIDVAPYPRHPAGMTPSALALSPDANRLMVVCSNANAVAVVDVAAKRSKIAGFVPAGWYPTAARVLPDGRLLVLNGKGERGSVSVVNAFDENALASHTRVVKANSLYNERKLEMAHDALPGHPVPRQPGERSPIEHVVYVLKGSVHYGPENVSPNHHKLAREFASARNFHTIGEASEDGLYWSTAAIAPDFIEKLSPGSIAGRRPFYGNEGGEPAALPPAGYIWTQALSAGLTMRNFGLWVANHPKPGADGVQVQTVRDPALRPVTSMQFRGFDPQYLDIERARVFLSELAKWESDGVMPRYVQIRLGNDRPGQAAAMADNDYALGMIVEALSRGKFWPKMAIFVAETSAPPAFVISPFSARGQKGMERYNTASVLRTMELILGLNPMTHFDAGAEVMTELFQVVPDTRPFVAEKPRIPLDSQTKP